LFHTKEDETVDTLRHHTPRKNKKLIPLLPAGGASKKAFADPRKREGSKILEGDLKRYI